MTRVDFGCLIDCLIVDHCAATEAGILLKYRLMLCTTENDSLIEDGLLFFADSGDDDSYAFDEFCFYSFLDEVNGTHRYLTY